MKKININATNCTRGSLDSSTRAIRDSALMKLTGTTNVRSLARSKSRNTNILKAQQVIKRANANRGLKVGSQGWKRNNAANYKYNTGAGRMVGGKRNSTRIKGQTKQYLKK